MNPKLSKVGKKAISSKNLQNRLNINKKLSSNDLTKWLFKRYKIKKNDKILELVVGGIMSLKNQKLLVLKDLFLEQTYQKNL